MKNGEVGRKNNEVFCMSKNGDAEMVSRCDEKKKMFAFFKTRAGVFFVMFCRGVVSVSQMFFLVPVRCPFVWAAAEAPSSER